jgi:hypothetical protein
MAENPTTKQPTEADIQALREKFPKHQLYQMELQDGTVIIHRGSSYDEFQSMVKQTKGNEGRLGLVIVHTFVVWPALDMQDMEYNTSGAWEPGKIAAVSEKIQENLGYSKEITVKKL